MKAKHGQSEGQPPPEKSSEHFFREIEIEFLIHELKDPIAVIETGLRTVLEKKEKYGSLTPRQEKTLKRALRNSGKARDMLNGLLEIGRSEAGCFICCRFRPAVSICSAILDALETLAGNLSDKFRADASQEEILKRLTQKGILVDISSAAVETEMVQDEIKFRQIIGNLIKNAMHHRKERVEIRMDREADQLLVEIADDGPGIDPVYHEMIFRRYAQVKECSIAPRNGHGLGLAGARILARCLGGDIELQSKKGKGATFRLRLPLNIEDGQN